MTVDRRRRSLLWAVLGVAGAATTGCGYSLAGRGNFLPSYIRVIGIPMFANNTSVYDIEQQFTERVRTEFLGRGRYQVVPQVEGADAVLNGTVAGLSLEPSGFNEQQQATRYLLRVNLKIEFRDVKANKLIWENPSLEIVDEYDLTTGQGALDPSAFLGQNRSAADRVADTVARRTVSSILEAF
ncbi:MAG: LptE family protein [Acidobacteria bacterium]|nr:LptE family protein [Acidobacteriota bacterium]